MQPKLLTTATQLVQPHSYFQRRRSVHYPTLGTHGSLHHCTQFFKKRPAGHCTSGPLSPCGLCCASKISVWSVCHWRWLAYQRVGRLLHDSCAAESVLRHGRKKTNFMQNLENELQQGGTQLEQHDCSWAREQEKSRE